MTLIAPGVELNLRDNSAYTISASTTTPLIFIATRANKTTPNGDAIAAGTLESNTLRAVTSQRDVLQAFGTPGFVTSFGAPVHGDETNEYGLHALWSYMATSNLAYTVRADIDLAGLEPTTDEPSNPPANGTLWINSSVFKGAIYRRNAAGTAWVAVNVSLVTTSPDDDDGAAGDFVFDYSTTSGTLKVKTDALEDAWVQIGAVDFSDDAINELTGTAEQIYISAVAPTGAAANDYWWKTSEFNLGMYRYRAADNQWVAAPVLISALEPLSANDGDLWMDISTIQTNGESAINIYNTDEFESVEYTITDNIAPTLPAEDGDLWYNDDFTDFALYRSNGTTWTEIVTATTASPSATQKVFANVAPVTPATGAIWVDTGDLENYPVVKRYNGVSWEDISASLRTTYIAPGSANGDFFLNLDDLRTKFTVKIYDSTYEPVTIDTGLIDDWEEEDGRWKPYAGLRFGRRAQRYVVTRALQEAVSSTEGLASEGLRYALLAAPGYPELYDELVNLGDIRKQQLHVVGDVPFTMKAAGIPVGREVLASDWKNNTAGADETGELGFSASGTWTASLYYPHGLSTNSNGQTIMVPSSTLALRSLQYADSVRGVGHPAFGFEAGVVNNATAVGYLTNDGLFKNISLSEGEAGVLYNLSINPFMNYFNVGLRNMGNKTTYGLNSKLSEQHIARLVSKMKFDIAISLRRFIGTLNNSETWAMTRNAVERYLAGLMAGQILEDFVVRCNEVNNSAERRNRRELWVDIAIIPTSAVEFVYIDLGINSSGDVI